MPSLADRLITGWYTWLFRRKANAHAVQQTHAFELYRELPVGVDASDPEAELCSVCGAYPATWQGCCFSCNARTLIAARRMEA